MSQHNPGAGLTLRFPPSGSGVVGRAAPKRPRLVKLTVQWLDIKLELIEPPVSAARVAAGLIAVLNPALPFTVSSTNLIITHECPSLSWTSTQCRVALEAVPE